MIFKNDKWRLCFRFGFDRVIARGRKGMWDPTSCVGRKEIFFDFSSHMRNEKRFFSIFYPTCEKRKKCFFRISHERKNAKSHNQLRCDWDLSQILNILNIQLNYLSDASDIRENIHRNYSFDALDIREDIDLNHSSVHYSSAHHLSAHHSSAYYSFAHHSSAHHLSISLCFSFWDEVWRWWRMW